jgi:uncharacterized MAPEG superfamily protein
MSLLSPLAVLIVLALWAMALAFVLVGARAQLVSTGKRDANGFPANEAGAEFHHRAGRAHANMMENLGLFAAVILGSVMLNAASPQFALLANIALAGRLAQSLTHLASVSPNAVRVRALFYAVQIVCLIWMAVIALTA